MPLCCSHINRSLFANFFGLVKFMRMRNNNKNSRVSLLFVALQTDESLVFFSSSILPYFDRIFINFCRRSNAIAGLMSATSQLWEKKKPNRLIVWYSNHAWNNRLRPDGLGISFKLNINKNFRIKTFQLFEAIDNQRHNVNAKPKSSFTLSEKCLFGIYTKKRAESFCITRFVPSSREISQML